MARVLIVEDDPDLGLMVRNHLEKEGHEASLEVRGTDALARLRVESFDALCLDLMLPDRSGFELCREVRDEWSELPLIIMTACGAEEERVRGLDLGADDYVTKPFGLRELSARLSAVLRRTQRSRGPTTASTVHRLANAIGYEPTRSALRIGTREVTLTFAENTVLEALIERAGEVVNRTELHQRIWGVPWLPGDRSVDRLVVRLRRLLGDDPRAPGKVQSVYGVGYRWIHSLNSPDSSHGI